MVLSTTPAPSKIKIQRRKAGEGKRGKKRRKEERREGEETKNQ